MAVDLSGYARHLGLMGHISVLWNTTESYMNILISVFVRTELQGWVSVGMILEKLGNRDKLLVLDALVAQYPMGRIGERRIREVAKAFSVMNQNRNTLVHSSYFIGTKASELELARPSRSKPGTVARVSAPIRTLKRQIKILEKLNEQVWDVGAAIQSRRLLGRQPRPWPAKFPLPRVLPDTTPQPPIAAQAEKLPRRKRKGKR
jgi:hypothetical protein